MTSNETKSMDVAWVAHSANSGMKRMWCPWLAATDIDSGLCQGQAVDQA